MFGNPVGDRIARRRKSRREQFLWTCLRSRPLRAFSIALLALAMTTATSLTASSALVEPSATESSAAEPSASATPEAPDTVKIKSSPRLVEVQPPTSSASEPATAKNPEVRTEPSVSQSPAPVFSAVPSETPKPPVESSVPSESPAKPSPIATTPKSVPPVESASSSPTKESASKTESAPSASATSSPSSSPSASAKELSMMAAAANCTVPQFNNSIVGNFEIDGNLCSNVQDDWTTVLSGPTANDGVGDSTQFTNGVSEGNWPWTTGQTSGVNTSGDKSDIHNVYALQRTIGTDVYAFLGFERATGNGTAQLVVELNALPNATATTPSPHRSTGDLRLLVNQSGNNNLVLTQAEKWTATSASSGTWTALPSLSGFTGTANNGVIKNFSGTADLEKGLFAEFALNLTALFGAADCSGTYGTLNIRSSASGDTSALKDWVAPISLNVPSTCSSVVVDKSWVIDGQEYANGDQPAGFNATLKLTGQTAPKFGTEYTTRNDNSRYHADQTITVAETGVQIPEGCTYEASGDLGDHTLAVGRNRYQVTNTVTCTQLTLVKKVIGSAAPDSWTLKATGPTPLSGHTGDDSVTEAAVTPGQYTLSESGGVTGYQLTKVDCGSSHPVSDAYSLTIKAGDKVTCTLTNTAEVSLIVTKQWVVNGEDYADGEQPVGDAQLNVDGTDSEFGTAINGYLVGDEVTIKESVSDLPELCTMTSSIDGDKTDQVTHTMTVTPDPNVVEVVNTVDCVQHLTLIKEVDNEEFSGTSTVSDWTLTATNADDADLIASGITGAPSVTEASVPVGSYALSESGPAGYEAGTWNCTGTGEQTDESISLKLGQKATCTIVNTSKPGSVTWTKTDAQDRLLAGATWTLTGPAGDNSQAVQITDCTDEPCAGPDRDAAAGKFSIENLSWGDYTLTELLAPPGYQRDDTVHEFTVQGEELQVELAAVVNEQQVGPTLPLTGGLGRDHVYLLGAGILILGLSVLGGRFLRTRRDRTIR